MAASYIKILKSSANFTKVFHRNLRKLTNGCFYFVTTSNVYITHMQRVMQFSVQGKLKYMSPSLFFLSRFSEQLMKSSNKIDNSGNLQKLRDLFYLLFLIRAGP